MTPRSLCVVDGVAGDGCSLRATRGRLDDDAESGFLMDGQDGLLARYKRLLHDFNSAVKLTEFARHSHVRFESSISVVAYYVIFSC